MRNTTLWLLFFGLFFGNFSTVLGQTPEDVKVGLVLSGGGAKAFAHIGVLKEIEAAGLRIDYIGGTSMGAVIGGLYAAGYSAHQLDSLFNTFDFNAILTDDLPRQTRSITEKAESDRYVITFPFDGKKLTLPSGLSRGHNAYNILSKLLLPVRDVTDFRDLPIPFLCIATDAEKGTQVILDHGYLPRALTASSALPTIVQPILMEGILHIDGGVVNNYPVAEIRAMGAEVIIGVDVQDNLLARDQLNSVVDIVAQINNFRTIERMTAKIDRTDIYIEPEMNQFTVLSFKDRKAVIDLGQKAAQMQREKFAELAKRQQAHVPREGISAADISAPLEISNVRIEGHQGYTRSYIMGKLGIRSSVRMTPDELQSGINNLAATNNFSSIDYFFESQSDTTQTGSILRLQMTENPQKSLVRFGLHYDPLYRMGVLLNVTQKRLLGVNDKASIDVVIGDYLRYRAHYFVDKGYHWSVGLTANFSQFNHAVGRNFTNSESEFDTSIALNQIDIKYKHWHNQFQLLTRLNQDMEFSLGANHQRVYYFSETVGLDEDGLPRTVFEDNHYVSAFAQIEVDTRDHGYYPTQGGLFRGTLEQFLYNGAANENHFTRAQINTSYAWPLGLSFFVAAELKAGASLGDKSPEGLDFFMGGYGYQDLGYFVPFFGQEVMALRGNSFLLTQVNATIALSAKSRLLARAQVGGIGHNLFDDLHWRNTMEQSSVALGYAIETFLGPLELWRGYASGVRDGIWQLSLGYRF